MSTFVKALESFPYTPEGRVNAQKAVERHALTLVKNKAVKRFSVGSTVVRDETTRGDVILVALYRRDEEGVA